jgi:hypothetical protein
MEDPLNNLLKNRFYLTMPLLGLPVRHRLHQGRELISVQR